MSDKIHYVLPLQMKVPLQNHCFSKGNRMFAFVLRSPLQSDAALRAGEDEINLTPPEKETTKNNGAPEEGRKVLCFFFFFLRARFVR